MPNRHRDLWLFQPDQDEGLRLKMHSERIPDARLRVIPGGGHQILVEQAEACNEAILAFLGS